MDLFTSAAQSSAPLADRMRPRTLNEFVGQTHLIGPGKLLRRAIEADRLLSCIFWGPPGTGKTTLAAIAANATNAAFAKLNAVTSGVADVRKVIEEAENRLKLYRKPTYLLLDECHRWNKAQSDCILPAIESGVLRFVGSTTENPTIAMTPAIVSRCRLFAFELLGKDDIMVALEAAIADKDRGLGHLTIEAHPEALEHIAIAANGDARCALNALELAALTTPPDERGTIIITPEVAADSIQSPVLPMDESLYYDMLSAFCKSLRGGDPDAALFWYARMLAGGVDPRIPVRRLMVHASEDVGLANPNAMLIAQAAHTALVSLGVPEANIPITQAIIYVCLSPKSNSVVAAMGAAFEAAGSVPHEPVPIHLRDTAYKGAAKLGHGTGYKYPHDYPGHVVEQEYMPPAARGMKFYRPSDQGQEKKRT